MKCLLTAARPHAPVAALTSVLLCSAAAAQHLAGFDLPAHGRTGVFTPGLVQGYAEDQVIPFKVNLGATALQDAAARAQTRGSTSQYLITIIIPTHSSHTPPFPSEANAMSEVLTGVETLGDHPHTASVANYEYLDNAEAPAKGFLGGGGRFVFGITRYQPRSDQWEARNTIGAIRRVVTRFHSGDPYFPGRVIGVAYDVHFDITALHRGSPYQEATVQFGARLAASGLPAIAPGGGGAYPGACTFHPGPGMLHVAFEVRSPTGRSTVPLVCRARTSRVHLIEIRGHKWCDSAVDHRRDPGDAAIPGVTIELREQGCSGTLLDSAITAPDGSYRLCTFVADRGSVSLAVLETSTGLEQALDARFWAQTTPQTDCAGRAIGADIFTVGTGVHPLAFADVRASVLLADRDLGNLRFGEVGERTPGFWCSQVNLEMTGQGGSSPCHQLIATCSGSVEARINRAIQAWRSNYCASGANRLVFDPFDSDQNGHFSLGEASVILCPQVSEPFQFPRHLLALLLNVTDCPCTGACCGRVGSPLCLDQPIVLRGRRATVLDALRAACAGGIDHSVLAAINENRSTILVNCGY